MPQSAQADFVSAGRDFNPGLKPTSIRQPTTQRAKTHEGGVELEVAQRHDPEATIDHAAHAFEEEAGVAVELELGAAERPFQAPGAQSRGEGERAGWAERRQAPARHAVLGAQG